MITIHNFYDDTVSGFEVFCFCFVFILIKVSKQRVTGKSFLIILLPREKAFSHIHLVFIFFLRTFYFGIFTPKDLFL